MFSTIKPTKADYCVAIIGTLPIITRIIKFAPSSPNAIYYGALLFMAVYVLYKSSGSIYNTLTLAFLAFCGLSILINRINPVFEAGTRYLGFIFLVTACGTLIVSNELTAFRTELFKVLIFWCTFIGVSSFALGIVAPGLALTERGHLFGGITAHSMTLSPICCIATLYLLLKLITQWHNLSRVSRILNIVFALMCVLSALRAGSRSAIFALLVSATVWLWAYMRDNRRLFYKYLIGIVTVSALSFPLWSEYTETIQHKMEYSEQQGSLVATRTTKWEARIDEIADNPITGCGFATVPLDPDKDFSNSGYTGTVEPGNGWLFIWSSCGIFAFICFVCLYFKILIPSFRSYVPDVVNMLPFVLFFGLHIMAEGYTISPGMTQSVIMWSSLGLGYGLLQYYRE